MDFRSPARILPGVQDCQNRKGVISNRGQAFYTLQKFYAKKAGSGDPAGVHNYQGGKGAERKTRTRSARRTAGAVVPTMYSAGPWRDRKLVSTTKLCLGAVLEFFVPCHLDGFQLAFV